MFLNRIYSNYEKRNKLNQYISKLGTSKRLDDQLFLNGCYIQKDSVPLELIQRIIQRYCLNKENFNPTNKNLSLPLLDNNFLEYISSKNFNSLIYKYYDILYGYPPLLQVFPSIVITYPLINQNQFRSSDKNMHIPASVHTDYSTEFTIHIPLFDINENTPHTVYVEKSCTNIYLNDLITRISSSNLKNKLVKLIGGNEVSIFASPGDMIMLDVTGLHRAEIKPEFRAFIQLKYTIGNDRLNKLEESKKFKDSIAHTSLNYLSYHKYKVELQRDVENLFYLNLNDQYKIINESLGAYQAYLTQI
jgi:hypothetical protein